MKILFLTENYPPETNAAANRVHERAKFWAEWGHDVTVITCAPNFPKGRLHEGCANKWYQTGVICLLYTSPSPRDVEESRMPSSA